MADRQELERAVERDLSSRDAKRVREALSLVIPQLEEKEQILKTAAGTWYSGQRCLVVATSRRVIAADDNRVDPIPYDRLLSLDFKESWRKARLTLRAQGAGADVRDVHLDAARELKTIIETARLAPTPPPG